MYDKIDKLKPNEFTDFYKTNQKNMTDDEYKYFVTRLAKLLKEKRRKLILDESTKYLEKHGVKSIGEILKE